VSKFERYLHVLLFVLLPLAAYHILREVYEQTVLSWDAGPQMVGFSALHSGPIFALMSLAALLVLFVTTVALTVLALVKKVTGTRKPLNKWSLVGLSLAWMLVLLSLPSYGFWKLVFIDRIMAGGHAQEFLVDAASRGDLRVVKALVERGVSVDSVAFGTTTPLYAASLNGEVAVLRYLLDHGANPNENSNTKKLPLDIAEEMKQDEAAALLRERGARKSE
jgi:hypothetical protein